MTRDEILKRRAERLASRRPLARESTESTEVVEVTVGAERFGFVSALVREVVPRPTLTPLPGLPAHLRGAATVRGEVVGVVDLGASLGLTTGEDAFLVVVEHPRGPVGLLVDAVTGFRRVPASAWSGAGSGSSAGGAAARPLLGVMADGLQLLDATRLVEATAVGSPS